MQQHMQDRIRIAANACRRTDPMLSALLGNSLRIYEQHEDIDTLIIAHQVATNLMRKRGLLDEGQEDS